MESFLFISDLLNWKQDTYFEGDYRPVMVQHQHEGSALNGVINLMIKTDHVKMLFSDTWNLKLDICI